MTAGTKTGRSAKAAGGAESGPLVHSMWMNGVALHEDAVVLPDLGPPGSRPVIAPDQSFHLDPLPPLADSQGVRVALPAAARL